MNNNAQFDQIQIVRPPSNRFDLSHERKMSMNMGGLYPIMVQDVIPGDRFKISSEIFIRFAPMLAPIMHRVNVYTHFFFVPNRLTYNEWEDFITGGEDGNANPGFPQIPITESSRAFFQKGSLSDYLGIPIPPAGAITNNLFVNALPYRAYQMIFNEYYRDQNLTPKIPFDLGVGIDDQNREDLAKLRERAWEKDYFTSALPFAQKGGDVLLPVQSSFTPQYLDVAQVINDGGGIANNATLGSAAAAGVMTSDGPSGQNQATLHNLQDPQLVSSTSVTIEELRRAVRLQEWLEKNARGGSRYIESMLVHFGVRSSDARLQRPEYLGGGKQPVVISEVLNTAGTNSPSGDPTDMQAVGEQAGHGVSVGRNNSFKKTFEEHGFIIGIISVLPRTAYQQGINRMWKKFDKFDYAWPEFSQLGEQEIKQEEIYHDWIGATDQGDGTFGYQSRYAEYKYKESTVHGDFRDNLSFWTMARVFTTDPALNTQFITSDPTHNIFAVADPAIDKLYVQIYNKVSAVRPLPKFNTPKL